MDTDYAWAAGFMDGEGTITIKRYVRSGRVVYQPYISVAQAQHGNHFDAVIKMKELFGGSLSKWHAGGRRKLVLAWSTVSQQAIDCINEMYPFLVAKKKNAEILMRYREKFSGKRKSYRLSYEELEEREIFWNEIRLLNQKGNLRLQRLSEIIPKR